MANYTELIFSYLSNGKKLYRVLDIWNGTETEEATVLLENCETEAVKWMLISQIREFEIVYP